MEQEKNLTLGDLLRRLWFLIKNNWILITAIVLAFILGGVGYSYLRKPTYISSRAAIYSSKLDSSTINIYDHTSTVNMMDTFIDFCDEPVVLRRANYYYQEYLKYKESNPNNTIKDYVEKLNLDKQTTFGGKDVVTTVYGKDYDFENDVGIKTENYAVPNYVPKIDDNGLRYAEDKHVVTSKYTIDVYEGNPALDKFEELTEVDGAEYYDFKTYIKAEDVKVTANKLDQSETLSFKVNVSCSDKNLTVATEKAEIFIWAIKHEASKPTKVQLVKTTYTDTNSSLSSETVYRIDYKYFEAKINLEDFGNIGFTTDISKSKIIILTAIIGVVFAGLAVAVVYLMDRTVRSKEELEEIAGCNVLAVISTVSEGK